MISNKIKLVSKSSLSSFMMLLLLLVMGHTVKLYAQNPPSNQNPQNPQATLAARPPSQRGPTLRAPDTLPGTLPEMRDPSYWISRMTNPDAVVLPTTEIQNRNRAYIQRMDNYSKLDSGIQEQINAELNSRPGLMTSIPDMTTKTPAEVSAFVNTSIDKEITFVTRRRLSNILGIQYADWEITNISDEMSSAKTADQIKIQAAITVKDCRLRIVPAVRPEYTGGTSWDMWNFDIIPVASLVTILSTSKTGGFLFVLCEKGYGWVNSEEVAIASLAQIENFCNSRDFILCTGDRVPFYSDSSCTYVSGWFRMGDHLGVKDNNNTRSILVPTRLMNGRLSIQDAWLKRDADVNRGYLPYTRKNVVVQTFKLLDNIYDWTGGWYGRDHATQLRDIFSTFGFRWPSMGGLLSSYQSIVKVIYPKDGQESQIKAILTNDPFTTIQICGIGHAQLLLGNYNGVPIVFDTHGYSYEDSKGNTLMVRRSNVGTQALPDYFLKHDAI